MLSPSYEMADYESAGEPAYEEIEHVTLGGILRTREMFKKRPGATIYRVPPEIYACDKNAYQPRAVCIGPFFYDRRYEEALVSMQDYKWDCIEKIFSGKDDPLLNKCWKKIGQLEKRVRRSYSEEFPSLDPNTFIKMLLLDGCFLLDLLLRSADGAERLDDVDVARKAYGRLWIWSLVRYDLLLLQNQIPFFVIQSLHELLYPDDNNTNLVNSAINFFGILDPLRKLGQSKFYRPVGEVDHLLHLIYLSLLPCPQYSKPSTRSESPPWIPSATELERAGMKFTKRKDEGGFLSFLHVKFSDGVMEIPQLKLYDYSIILFRNLIAFEQCYPDTECQITAYAAFMNLLINTKHDMRLLHLNGILINSMTVDKDAIHFFSRLCNEVHLEQRSNYLRQLLADVNKYYDSTWHKWRAYLFRQYFSNPWSIISLSAGALALFISIFGTIYNVATRH